MERVSRGRLCCSERTGLWAPRRKEKTESKETKQNTIPEQPILGGLPSNKSYSEKEFLPASDREHPQREAEAGTSAGQVTLAWLKAGMSLPLKQVD